MEQKSGCYGCEERKAGCHSNCERYKEWKAERDALQAAIRAEKEERRKLDHQSFVARAKTRREKMHGKKW